MRLTRVLIGCLLVLLTTNTVHAQQDTAAVLFDKLRAKLNNVEDYVADVKVKIDVSFMKVPALTGKMFFKAPDKMKLERNGGISILPKKNMSLSLNSMFPVGDVTVLDAGKKVLEGKEVRVLKVIPDNDATDIVLTKIWVDESRLLALRTETTTKDNGTVKMNLEFGDYIKQGLPDKVTVFLDVKEYKLPKGVTMDYDVSDAGQAKQPATEKSKKGTIEIKYNNYEINKGLSDSIFNEND